VTFSGQKARLEAAPGSDQVFATPKTPKTRCYKHRVKAILNLVPKLQFLNNTAAGNTQEK
jgi:hypothetical protein